VILLEADRLRARAERRNGGFVSAMWFSATTLRTGGSGRGRSSPSRAGRRAGRGSAGFCSEQEVGRVVPADRIPAGLRRTGPRRCPGRSGRDLPRARRGRPGSGAERGSGGPAVPVASIPWRRALPGRRDGAAGAVGARPARAAHRAPRSPSLRGLAASPAPRRVLGLPRRDAGGSDPRRVVRPSRRAGVRRSRLAAARPPHRHLQPHRAD
jgi:hypothetical protein